MTIATVDQMYRTEQMDGDGPMFPAGPKQMLGFIYSMEGEIARQTSWHAKMIAIREAFDGGEIRPFSLHRLNLKGLGPLEINGECAGLREQVWEHLGDCLEYHAARAKFGVDGLEATSESMGVVAIDLLTWLSSGRARRQRSVDYCVELVCHACCGYSLAEKRYSVTAISRRANVSQPTVSRDCDEAKRFISKALSRCYDKLQEKFADGCVLPLRE